MKKTNLLNHNMKIQLDILSLWNRTANNTGVTNHIKDTFRQVLNLPPGTTIDYKAQNNSMVVRGGRFNTHRKVSRIQFVTPVSFAVRFHKDNISS